VAKYSRKGEVHSRVAVMEVGACLSARQEPMESECGGIMSTVTQRVARHEGLL